MPISQERVRRLRRHTAVSIPGSDQLAALHGKVFVNQLAVGNPFAAGDRFTLLQCDCFLGTFEMLSRKLDNLPARIAARKFDCFAHDCRRAARTC